MMQMDFADWLLFALAMYPIIGMLFFAFCIVVMSSEYTRGSMERNGSPPILVVLAVAALAWPLCIAKAVRLRRER
jgi:uncharacterized RDD family membrane protein YckC